MALQFWSVTTTANGLVSASFMNWKLKQTPPFLLVIFSGNNELLKKECKMLEKHQEISL